MPKAKYFIAIVMPSPQLGNIERIKEELLQRFGLKGAMRSPAHITLHRPFEWREERESELVNALSGFPAVRPFQIALNGISSFGSRVVFIDVKPSRELESLHDSLAKFARSRLQLYNEIEDERGFHPHVTVAFRDLRRTRFEDVFQYVSGTGYEGDFDYEGFSLLKLGNRWEQLRFFPADGRVI